MKWSVRSLVASALLIACALTVSACGESGISAGGGISVGADPADLIREGNFIDWEDLPVPVSTQEVYHQAEPQGGMILPGSEPRRLLVLVWGNNCMPRLRWPLRSGPGCPN